jgi:phosphoglucosamine mutase
MRQLFGTDGIRGKAGEPPLDAATASRVGAALVATLRREGAPDLPRIVIGCDTRASSPWLVEALAGGVAAAGGIPVSAGVLPTPGVAHAVRATGAAAGLVVSASHNPWEDNGIKVFSAAGRKLPDAVELELEEMIGTAGTFPPLGVPTDQALVEEYVRHLAESLPHRLDGLKVVLDAANGAAYLVGPEAFRRAGAHVVEMNVAPDGKNINAGCGALHPEAMAARTAAEKADLGLALDGDADRVMMADSEGRALDGDDILWFWTLEMEREGRLPEAVVGTVMSNWGLEEALAKKGVRLIRAAVGDRYVVEEMERSGAVLGGEQSGHLIHAERSTTGDGLLTGMAVASLVAATHRPLAGLPRIERSPQVLLNVRVTDRPPMDRIPGLAEEQEKVERLLAGRGRVLLRYSGTETLLRVMVEGADAAVVHRAADSLARVVSESIGEKGDGGHA